MLSINCSIYLLSEILFPIIHSLGQTKKVNQIMTGDLVEGQLTYQQSSPMMLQKYILKVEKIKCYVMCYILYIYKINYLTSIINVHSCLR